MADETERARLVAELSNLELCEFLDVMRRVLPEFAEDDVGGLKEALVLARAWWEVDHDNPASRADLTIEFVAWADGSRYPHDPLGPNQGLYEDGTCLGCGTTVGPLPLIVDTLIIGS